MPFTPLPEPLLLERLTAPSSPVSMVLDTDTFNEIDDQFALAYALRSPERMTVDAVYAAPFHNNRSTGPADGMEKSYEEIFRVMERLPDLTPPPVIKGSTRFMEDATTPVDSPAARDLVARAMARPSDGPPLYVVAIGAITNVAAALLMEPKIIGRIVVLWLGGHGRGVSRNDEFNLRQDPHAARVVFDCGVPLIWFPCVGVVSHVTTTLSELERDLAGRSAIGDYLTEIVRGYSQDHFAWGKVIWDVAPIAWLVEPKWLPTRLSPSPLLAPDLAWEELPGRHSVREATYANRNGIFKDVFRKLGSAPPQ